MNTSFQPIRKSVDGNICYTSDSLNYQCFETAGFLLREVTRHETKQLVKQYIIANKQKKTLSILQDILDTDVVHINSNQITCIDQVYTNYEIDPLSDKKSNGEWTYSFRIKI
jgi:hypothetical protein